MDGGRRDVRAAAAQPVREAADGRTAAGLVWYAAYGSNMRADRLACYLAGGRPPGGARTYPGCRDRRPPERAVPVMLPGMVYFALESPVWGGGIAFYDLAGEGTAPARAYLLTLGQFSDLAAQEMHRPPGADLDLSRAVATGRDRLGPGPYETLVCAGAIDGVPLCTVTAPWRLAGAELNAPSAAYLAHIAGGLAEAHGWPPERAAEYLATRPGAAGRWTASSVLDTLR